MEKQAKLLMEMDVDAQYLLDYQMHMEQVLRDLDQVFVDAEQHITTTLAARAQAQQAAAQDGVLPLPQRAKDEVPTCDS